MKILLSRCLIPCSFRGQVMFPVEGTAVVQTTLLVPCSIALQSTVSGRDKSCSIGDAVTLSCVNFLSAALSRKVSQGEASNVVKGLRESSLRQYESCWHAFQSFLHAYHFTEVSQNVVFWFLHFLFHWKQKVTATTCTHRSALANPLWFSLALIFSWSKDA